MDEVKAFKVVARSLRSETIADVIGNLKTATEEQKTELFEDKFPFGMSSDSDYFKELGGGIEKKMIMLQLFSLLKTNLGIKSNADQRIIEEIENDYRGTLAHTSSISGLVAHGRQLAQTLFGLFKDMLKVTDDYTDIRDSFTTDLYRYGELFNITVLLMDNDKITEQEFNNLIKLNLGYGSLDEHQPQLELFRQIDQMDKSLYQVTLYNELISRIVEKYDFEELEFIKINIDDTDEFIKAVTTAINEVQDSPKYTKISKNNEVLKNLKINIQRLNNKTKRVKALSFKHLMREIDFNLSYTAQLVHFIRLQDDDS
jgi:hypothetical protein